jgi:succinyl-CoA:mesaconate CoA transferase
MSQNDSADEQAADDEGPLSGLRVLDLTQMLAGPFATMIMADLGADVVKIEPPRGDMTRSNPPHLEEDEAYGGYFHSINRNKRSVVLDLKSDGGRETFLEMVEDADIVFENFKSERWTDWGCRTKRSTNAIPR